MKLSIVIPAYNEEKRILPTLEDYYTFFKEKLKDSFEIIIIPNNCDDKTLEVVDSFSNDKKEISIFEIKGYSGKGGAVLKGFELAKGDFIGFSDADGSTNAEQFSLLYDNLFSSEGIIGSRRMKNSQVVPKRSLMDRCNSFIFNFLEKIFVGLNFKDTQCGAKIFNKSLIKTFLNKSKEKGWIFDLDLLYLSKMNGGRIKEFPISWTDKEGTKLKFKDKVRSFFEVIKYGLNGPRKSWKQFFTFSVIGVISTLIHLGLLYFLTDFIKIYYLLSSVFGFVVANIFSFIANSRFTFEKKIDPRKRYHKFLIISLISLGINLSALYLFTEIFGLYYLLSQIVATLFSLWVNFLGNKFWTFRR
jgi:dolichol-phosphate mannosyltransferase